MYNLNNIMPSYLDNASIEELRVFFQSLIGLSKADGNFDKKEMKFVVDAAEAHGLTADEVLQDISAEKLIENLHQIKSRTLAMELIREMCMLSHLDSNLSDKETLFIGRAGLAMGIELAKIEQISNWVIDYIIWIEQAKIIFKE